MATKPSKAQAANASTTLSGEDVAVLLANESTTLASDMTDAGITVASTSDDGTTSYSLAENASIASLGKLFFSYDPNNNPFTNTMNMVGLQIAWFRSYNNNWAKLKRGRLDMGESVQELVNDLPDPHRFSPAVAESQVFRRELPKIYQSFHIVNMQRFYKQTLSQAEATLAFKSWDAFGRLFDNIVSAMATAMEADDKMLMRYQIAVAALNGALTPVTVPVITSDTAADVLETLRTLSDDFEEEDITFTAAGNNSNTPKANQILIQTNAMKNKLGVQGLADMYNISYADWKQGEVTCKSFTQFNWERMEALFTDPETGIVDAGYHKFTDDEMNRLDSIVGVLIDDMWFADYERDFEVNQIYNPQGRYWNRFMHKWDIYSFSPFAQAAVIVTTDPSITKVEISPSAVTVKAGSTTQLSASVTGTGIYSSAVTWSLEGAEASGTVIGYDGKLVIAGNESASEITVTATSVYDDSVIGTATVTIG